MSYYSFATDADPPQPYGSCEVYFMSAADVAAHWAVRSERFGTLLSYSIPSEADWGQDPDTDNPADLAGWYWQACFPGCLPDGDPCGPFQTETEALADAGCYVAD